MKYSLRSLMTFSIRELFLVTLLVAVCVAWWLDHRQLVSRIWVQKIVKTGSTGLIKGGGSDPRPIRPLHDPSAPKE